MARPQLTLDEFKQFAADVAPAARAVLMARVFLDMERARVAAYVQPIFESFGFTYGALARGHYTGLVPTPDDLYLVDNGPELLAFYDACDVAHRAHGFTGPKGHCPALTAEVLLRQTERAFIELAEPLFGISADSLYGEHRAKYLDLLIGAALKTEAA